MTIDPLFRPNRVILYLHAVDQVTVLSNWQRFIKPTNCWTWSCGYFVHRDRCELV